MDSQIQVNPRNESVNNGKIKLLFGSVAFYRD